MPGHGVRRTAPATTKLPVSDHNAKRKKPNESILPKIEPDLDPGEDSSEINQSSYRRFLSQDDKMIAKYLFRLKREIAGVKKDEAEELSDNEIAENQHNEADQNSNETGGNFAGNPTNEIVEETDDRQQDPVDLNPEYDQFVQNSEHDSTDPNNRQDPATSAIYPEQSTDTNYRQDFTNQTYRHDLAEHQHSAEQNSDRSAAAVGKTRGQIYVDKTEAITIDDDDDDDEPAEYLATTTSGYIAVCPNEGAEPVELPLESDGSFLFDTLQIEFNGALGLKYRNPNTGYMRVIKVGDDGRFRPPPEGWNNLLFIACVPSDAKKRPWMNEGEEHPTTTAKSDIITTKSDAPAPAKTEHAPAIAALHPGPRMPTLAAARSQFRPIGEKTKIYDICQICNVELNSKIQADFHYKGKKHIHKAENSSSISSAAASSSMQHGPGSSTSSGYRALSNRDGGRGQGHSHGTGQRLHHHGRGHAHGHFHRGRGGHGFHRIQTWPHQHSPGQHQWMPPRHFHQPIDFTSNSALTNSTHYIGFGCGWSAKKDAVYLRKLRWIED